MVRVCTDEQGQTSMLCLFKAQTFIHCRGMLTLYTGPALPRVMHQYTPPGSSQYSVLGSKM